MTLTGAHNLKPITVKCISMYKNKILELEMAKDKIIPKSHKILCLTKYMKDKKNKIKIMQNATLPDLKIALSLPYLVSTDFLPKPQQNPFHCIYRRILEFTCESKNSRTAKKQLSKIKSWKAHTAQSLDFSKSGNRVGQKHEHTIKTSQYYLFQARAMEE